MTFSKPEDIPDDSAELDDSRAPISGEAGQPASIGLLPLVSYFLKLGTLGFGGPVALVGYMHRDLVGQRGWIDEDTYQLALALAQIMPGPLAAQCAIAIGYFQAGIVGATLVGLAFVLPSFIMVLAISMLYVAYGGLWWMQALFYGIGAAVIGIIAIAAYRLSRSTNRHDPLLWGIFGVLALATIWAQAELAEFFILAGLLVLLARARPRGHKAGLLVLALATTALGIGLTASLLPQLTFATSNVLAQILVFFTKAGAFVFGSGLAIVPFLYQGAVQQFGWLTEHQFLDAVAIAMITPGPVVITVAFIGYLVAGLPGATLAAIGIFLPVYIFTVLPAPWFKHHRENAQLRAFVQGATAAATGAITGAVVVLAQRTILEQGTTGAVIGATAITMASLGMLLRFKLSEPILVAAAGLVGLAVWPLIQTGG